MSEPTSSSRRSSSRRRGGSSRRRSSSRPSGSSNSSRGPRSSERSRSRSGDRASSKRPAPQPLTWWQKLLKAIGLYQEPAPAPRETRRESGARSSGESRRPKRERPDPKEVTRTKLYLGNLSFDATEGDVEELLKGVGPVRQVEIVYNRHTHRSKGYGFATMANVEDAARAVEVLHDQPFMGRTLIVNEARSNGPVDSSEPQEEESA